MSSVGDYVYSLSETAPDRLGVKWITLLRRVIVTIEGGVVTLSRAVYADYPDHTPPASLAAARWQLADDVGLVVNAGQIGAGKSWDPAPVLGDAEVIDTAAVTAALLEHRSHKYNNRDRGMPAPVLELEQERLFSIAEWREVRW